MAFCRSCGSFMPDEARFCTECGTKSIAEETPVVQENMAPDTEIYTAPGQDEYIPPVYTAPVNTNEKQGEYSPMGSRQEGMFSDRASENIQGNSYVPPNAGIDFGQPGKPSRKGGPTGRIVGIIITAVALLVAAFFAFGPNRGSGGKKAEPYRAERAGSYVIKEIIKDGNTSTGAEVQKLKYFITLNEDGTAIVNFGKDVAGSWDDKTISAGGSTMQYIKTGDRINLTHPKGYVMVFELGDPNAEIPVAEETAAPATPAPTPKATEAPKADPEAEKLMGYWYCRIEYTNGTGKYEADHKDAVLDGLATIDKTDAGKLYFEIYKLDDVSKAPKGDEDLILTTYIKNVNAQGFEFDADAGEFYIIDEEVTDPAAMGKITFNLGNEDFNANIMIYEGQYKSADGSFDIKVIMRKNGATWDDSLPKPPNYDTYLKIVEENSKK